MPKGRPEEQQDPVRIDGYGPITFTISGQRIRGSVALRQSGVLPWKDAARAGLLEAAARELLADFRPPGIVLIGTGRERLLPEHAFTAWFRTHGIEPEVMTTGAACRTWNVLAAEGREVIAGLMPASWHPAQMTG